MKLKEEYSHHGDLVFVVDIIDSKTVVVSNEDAASEYEVAASELQPRSEAVRGFWD